MRKNAAEKFHHGDEPPCRIQPTNPSSASLGFGQPSSLIRLGGILGELAYRLDKPHRCIVHRNLSFAYPSWEERQVAATARRMFQSFGMSLMEVLQLLKMSRSDVLTRCVLTGADHMHQALSRGRGIVLVSGHLGNWELGLQFLTCRFDTPIHLVVNPLSPRKLNAWVNRVRARFGNRIIDKKKAFPAMRKAIREGGIVALMVDLSRVKQSVEVAFFGHRARASHAAALLATRTGATVMPVFSHRDNGGRIAIDLGPALIFQRSHNLKGDLKHNTQVLTDKIEAAVRKHPDQYLWVQKRWKDYYPNLYPGYRPRLEYLEE
jgi:KDO2-lipid IV(A) lauroyltransferase